MSSLLKGSPSLFQLPTPCKQNGLSRAFGSFQYSNRRQMQAFCAFTFDPEAAKDIDNIKESTS